VSELIEQQQTEPLERAERQLAHLKDAFEFAQREAKLLASSDFAPKAFKGNVPNCVIAMNLARRFGFDPTMVMQNVAIIHGKPAWEAKFLIALINNSRQFERLTYVFSGTRGQDSYGCRVVTKDRATGERIEGTIVDLAMAKAEGWYHKEGSKWKTMPEQMLIYRSASFFARQHCPELLLGMQAEDEAVDIEPVQAAPKRLEDLIDEVG
jgi:hypothetical protein